MISLSALTENDKYFSHIGNAIRYLHAYKMFRQREILNAAFVFILKALNEKDGNPSSSSE